MRTSVATEFKKGQRPSVATEFRRGQHAHNKAAVGEVRIRIETHTGLSRAWIKIAEPNAWQKRAVVVWVSAHGPLKRGLVIHHKDRDSLNDSIDNLQALSRAEHLEEHRDDV